ncbi:MAG TPA: hypothetical protein VHR86_05825, partial [Armatimonadota bacterium]|nr:hypothetical protein [Armatimonadota bacterium]
LLSGFLLTVTCFIGRLDEDFLFASVRTGRGMVPVGILILLVSLLFFPLALLFYLITAVMEGAASRQMLCILGFSSAALFLFAVVQPSAGVQTLLFGGNIVFPCMILGGFAGGFFRDPW